MSLCASCGAMISGDSALCDFHHSCPSGNWAQFNRVMCDFFHRGKEPERLSIVERQDDWGTE